jgi:hypothetical protein
MVGDSAVESGVGSEDQKSLEKNLVIGRCQKHRKIFQNNMNGHQEAEHVYDYYFWHTFFGVPPNC